MELKALLLIWSITYGSGGGIAQTSTPVESMKVCEEAKGIVNALKPEPRGMMKGGTIVFATCVPRGN